MKDVTMDLQLFAVDNAAEVQVNDTSSADTPSASEASAESVTIPAELDGISEDIAKSIMEEAGMSTEPEDEEGEMHDDGTQPSASADADSDTKHVADDDVLDMPKTSIPYPRFKQLNDKLKAAEAELEKLRKEQPANPSGSSPTQPAAATPKPAPAMPQQGPVTAGFKLTADVAAKIEEYAKQEAMRMSGLSKEDLDNLAYADDDDPNKVRWTTALNLSRNAITNSVIQAAQVQQQRQQAFIQQHQAMINDFNTFTSEQMKDENFENIRDFAIDEYYKTKSPMEQQIINAAWERVQRNTASPAEYLTVVNYFKEAKAAYAGKSGAPSPVKESAGASLSKAKKKVAEANKLPRSQQIEGSAATDGKAVTVESLQHLLDTTPWDKIPDEYKQMLLSGSIQQ